MGEVRGRVSVVRVATVGNFDGVHRGHRALIDRARALAGADGVVVAVTFDPHPQAVVRPESAPQVLTSLTRRIELLREAGADDVAVISFTPEVAAWSPEEFARFLRTSPDIAADAVVVGENFRFGQRAAGDVAALADFGAALGFSVDGVELLRSADDVLAWSSTAARDFIAAGDLEAAAAVLGRPHRVEGTVVHGDHRGRELGYPTANLDVAATVALPPDGVYAAWLVDAAHPGTALPAAVSIGTNPQFDGVERRIEAYVLDRTDLDLYGHSVALDLITRLRGQAVFDSTEGLIEQMGRDVAAARAALDG